jgi:hypothetical protein
MPTVLLFDAKKKFLKIYRGEVSAAALIRDFQAGANLHSRSSE